MSDLERDLAALLNPKSRGNGRLKPLSGRGPLPGKIGVGRPSVAAATAGIASPLTEVPRTGITERIYDKIDPAIYIDVRRAWKFTDANGAPVEFALAPL